MNLSYFSFNLFNYTNIFAILNYSKKIDQIRSLTSFESVIRTNTLFNSNFADERAYGFWTYSTYVLVSLRASHAMVTLIIVRVINLFKKSDL